MTNVIKFEDHERTGEQKMDDDVLKCPATMARLGVIKAALDNGFDATEALRLHNINTETAIRKRALRRGYRLRKTRGRDSHFELVDSDTGGSVFAEIGRPSLDDIAAFLN